LHRLFYRCFRSETIDVNDGLGKLLRRLLGQVA